MKMTFLGHGGEQIGGDGAIAVQPVPAAAAAVPIARGMLTVQAAAAARLKIRRGPKTGAASRIGMDPSGRDRTGWWEQLSFIALWLCSVFSVGYCLKTALLLSWSR